LHNNVSNLLPIAVNVYGGAVYLRRKILKKSHRIYGRQDIHWDGHRLRLSTGRLLATVEADRNWAGMYRVRMPGGHLSDMANLTWAKDAARSLATATLNNADKEAA
jgi:hypothetical protein